MSQIYCQCVKSKLVLDWSKLVLDCNITDILSMVKSKLVLDCNITDTLSMCQV